MNARTKKTILTALMAALVCIATMSIRIPVPSTGGYIHPGDGLVILSGIILGPLYGLLAAGIGSAMADLLGGYFIYVPITFFIKGLVAFACGYLFRTIGKTTKLRSVALATCGVVCIFIVAAGYFICESFLYGVAGAAASIVPNLVQGFSGMLISMLLYPILFSIRDVRESFYQ